MIIHLLLAAAMTMALGTSVEPLSGIYEDLQDTSSFSTAYDLADCNLEYAEVFSTTDDYDYVKYTAEYSRSIFLYIEASDNRTFTIDLYLESISLTTPMRSFTSSDTVLPINMTFLKQGDTVYYRIRCSGSCYWTGDLFKDINPSGTSYYNYEHFNGYAMPYTGTCATIYYYYDSSVYLNVPGQNFTFHVLFEEAMRIWEACGHIDFVFSRENALFTITIDDTLEEPEVFHRKKPFVNQYYCSEINIPGLVSVYEDIIDGCVMGYSGQEATLREGVLGITVLVMGLSLGLAMCTLNSYAHNHMRSPLPYSFLGDGDIASFIALWGDAYED